MTTVFDALHPALKAAVVGRGWSPTPVQDLALPALASGDEGVVVAPTGSGKTMAAVLPLLRDVRRGTRRLEALSCVKIQS